MGNCTECGSGIRKPNEDHPNLCSRCGRAAAAQKRRDEKRAAGETFIDELTDEEKLLVPGPFPEDGPLAILNRVKGWEVVVTPGINGAEDTRLIVFNEKAFALSLQLESGLILDPKRELYVEATGTYNGVESAWIYSLYRAYVGIAKYNTNVRRWIEDTLLGQLATVLYDYDDIDPFTLNFLNGRLIMRPGADPEFIEHGTDEYRNALQIPHRYVPDAPYGAWTTYLQVIPESQRRMLEELMGYLMTWDNDHQFMWLLIGKGEDGKSTFLRLVRKLLGGDNTIHIDPHALVESNFAASELYGKMACLVGDISARMLKDTDLLKKLTGQDPITADVKYKRPVTFINRARPVFAANKVPPSTDTTHGWWRRFIYIPFGGQPIANPDPTIEIKMAEQIEGIISGVAIPALQNILDTGSFYVSPESEAAKEKARIDSSSTANYIMKSEEVEWAPGERIQGTVLHRLYQSYTKDAGGKPLGRPRFYEELTEHPSLKDRISIEHDDVRNQKFIVGVKLRTVMVPVSLNPASQN